MLAGGVYIRTAAVIAVSLGASLGPVWAEKPAEPVPPRPRYELYLSPSFEAESGARDLAAAVTGIAEGEERLFRGLGPDRPGGGAGRRAGSLALRAVRAFVWDAPVAWWFGVALHETFGHGGRGREFHTAPGVHLGSPWQGRRSFASFDAEGKSTEELLYIYAGGAEANGIAATLLERRAVEGVRLRPLDLFFLAANRLVVSDYVLRTTPDPRHDPAGFYGEYSGGGDVAHYLGLLHDLNGNGAGIAPAGVDATVAREYRRLRRQARWNALDPGLWWALGSVFRQVAHGDAAPPLPLPHTARTRFLPVFSSEWTPSGGQTSLEWIASPLSPREGPGSPRWFSVVARRGRGPSGSFGALGATADDLVTAGPLSLGGTAELWRDPRHGLGGGARLRARVLRGSLRSLYIDIGVKSQGYWIAQPATAGLYLGVGIVHEP
jgi:hypothetical protein